MVVGGESKSISNKAVPHISVLASPGMGHVIPLWEFAKHLVTHHGFKVSFLNITTEASEAQNQLVHSSNLPRNLHVIDLPQVDLSGIVNDKTSIVAQLSVNVRESLRCLKSILVEIGNPQALVIDLFCTQAFDVCKELSIPTYSFFTASTHLLAFSLYLPKLDRDVEGEFVDLPEPVQVPGCSPIRTEDLLDQVRDRKSEEYRWYLYHLSRINMADGILLNTWHDLESDTIRGIREDPFYKEVHTPPLYPVGPLIKEIDPLNETAVQCLTWLDKQPSDSVLFVALGSGGTLTTEQITELAWGLELSKQRFVWVVRTPSDASSTGTFFNVGGDVNDPKTYLPEGFIERTREVGLLIPSWAPQMEVLKHRSTGAFLSHCGWNSTLESLAHGVPIIAWPLYAEQRMNATTLAHDQFGVAVKPVAEPGKKVIGRKETERVVRLVIEGEKGRL
ncbi:Glycosyltransferase [Quillaja saponaria]|uniref:Glycosyltransferase n=1 Tax=Quillaja saponaria TaxID=32244 RepID=A0AAD7PSW4_QUISA|nr:Glycosyltransferase [Quillaja saponaria]